MLEFEWDDAKAASNLRKHGVAFETARLVFDDVFASVSIDHSMAYGEERMVATGTARGVMLTVVFTERGDLVRLISARKATRHERHTYETGRLFR